MRVLADTCVWSLVLRRRDSVSLHAVELKRLIEDFQVGLIGSIRQEILSGIRDGAHFTTLRRRLRGFVDLPLAAEEHERAAEFGNTCRARGVQGSHTDFLICAAAERYDLAIYTVDEDFERFAALLPIRLHMPAIPSI